MSMRWSLVCALCWLGVAAAAPALGGHWGTTQADVAGLGGGANTDPIMNQWWDNYGGWVRACS